MYRALVRRAIWAETPAGELQGAMVMGSSPALVWAHGLGGCCAADEARGIGEILNPRILGRAVLRLDLRGHGRSASAHDPARGAEQYNWTAHSIDMLRASIAVVSRAFLGGEAMGAAVALHAATTAVTKAQSKSVYVPPGLVLMRPPTALAQAICGSSSGLALNDWRTRYEAAAAAVETGGFEGIRALEVQEPSLVDGAAAIYEASPNVSETLQQHRLAMGADVYAACLHGHASSQPPEMLAALREKQNAPMAADAYGQPMTLQCPVLLLAVPGDPDHPVEAAEQLAEVLDAELMVATDLEQARKHWAQRIHAFLRKAWMKEFLTNRVMPQ